MASKRITPQAIDHGSSFRGTTSSFGGVRNAPPSPKAKEGRHWDIHPGLRPKRPSLDFYDRL